MGMKTSNHSLSPVITRPQHFWDKPFWYRSTAYCVQRLPLWFLYGVAWLLGDFTYYASPYNRRAVIANLRQILGADTPLKVLRRRAKQVFRNFGRVMVDFFRFPHMKEEEFWKKIENWDERFTYIRKALDEGKGVLVLTGHLGNWEAGGWGILYSGCPMNVVTARHQVINIHRFKSIMREDKGIKVLEIGDSPFAMLSLMKVLKNNEVLAVLGDRDPGQEGHRALEFPFFGKPLRFPTGPIHLALLTGCELIPVFLVLTPRGTYRIEGGVPLPLTVTGDRNLDIKVNMEKWVHFYEEKTREFHEQWYNFYPVWGGVEDENK